MGRRQKTFSFMKHVQTPIAGHLQECDALQPKGKRCKHASPDCIDYCKKYNIGKVKISELCSNDKKGKDILL